MLLKPRWLLYIRAFGLQGAANTKGFSLIGFICRIAVEIRTLSFYIPMTGMQIFSPLDMFYTSQLHLDVVFQEPGVLVFFCFFLLDSHVH